VLTQQLLAFSRKQTIQPRVVDLNGVLVGLSPMLQRLAGEDIEFKIVQSGPVWPVLADPGQLEQVIFNLTVNAPCRTAGGSPSRRRTSSGVTRP
jgi:two-component system cell cycle sensor histidine kinase/response regulator CckA